MFSKFGRCGGGIWDAWVAGSIGRLNKLGKMEIGLMGYGSQMCVEFVGC